MSFLDSMFGSTDSTWEPVPIYQVVAFDCHNCGAAGDADDLTSDGCCPYCNSYDDVEEIPIS